MKLSAKILKKKHIKHELILLFSSILVGCAGSNTGADRADAVRSDCISQPSVRGYTVLDESNLIVSASGRRQYHMILQRRAYGLRSNWAIGLKSATGRICAPFSEVVFGGQFEGESVRIASIREISPEEEEHLLIRYGKKKPEIERAPPVPPEVKGAEVEELDTGAGEKSPGD